MIIEISGLQKAGKSTLIEGLSFDYLLYKFPMGAVCKSFGIKPTWEMQIAKDISTLEFYNQIVRCSEIDEIPTISDRGPLSTIYYSILFERAQLLEITKFVEQLSEYKESWKPVWVEGINQPTLTRNKDDGFDQLQDGLDQEKTKEAKNTMIQMLELFDIHPIILYNDFSNTIEENQKIFDEALVEIIRTGE